MDKAHSHSEYLERSDVNEFEGMQGVITFRCNELEKLDWVLTRHTMGQCPLNKTN